MRTLLALAAIAGCGHSTGAEDAAGGSDAVVTIDTAPDAGAGFVYTAPIICPPPPLATDVWTKAVVLTSGGPSATGGWYWVSYACATTSTTCSAVTSPGCNRPGTDDSNLPMYRGGTTVQKREAVFIADGIAGRVLWTDDGVPDGAMTNVLVEGLGNGGTVLDGVPALATFETKHPSVRTAIIEWAGGSNNGGPTPEDPSVSGGADGIWSRAHDLTSIQTLKSMVQLRMATAIRKIVWEQLFANNGGLFGTFGASMGATTTALSAIYDPDDLGRLIAYQGLISGGGFYDMARACALSSQATLDADPDGYCSADPALVACDATVANSCANSYDCSAAAGPGTCVDHVTRVSTGVSCNLSAATPQTCPINQCLRADRVSAGTIGAGAVAVARWIDAGLNVALLDETPGAAACRTSADGYPTTDLTNPNISSSSVKDLPAGWKTLPRHVDMLSNGDASPANDIDYGFSEWLPIQAQSASTGGTWYREEFGTHATGGTSPLYQAQLDAFWP